MGKTVTLTLDDKNKNLVDECEMEEIKNKTGLRERIRAGKREAENRKGRFVIC